MSRLCSTPCKKGWPSSQSDPSTSPKRSRTRSTFHRTVVGSCVASSAASPTRVTPAPFSSHNASAGLTYGGTGTTKLSQCLLCSTIEKRKALSSKAREGPPRTQTAEMPSSVPDLMMAPRLPAVVPQRMRMESTFPIFVRCSKSCQDRVQR